MAMKVAEGTACDKGLPFIPHTKATAVCVTAGSSVVSPFLIMTSGVLTERSEQSFGKCPCFVFVEDTRTDSHQDFLHLVVLKNDTENI